jgi:hypothetical protein
MRRKVPVENSALLGNREGVSAIDPLRTFGRGLERINYD